MTRVVAEEWFMSLVRFSNAQSGPRIDQDDEKPNAFTVIHELSKMMGIKGKIIITDAMACQKDIAEKI